MKPLARWSVRTPVAANVLMILLIAGGLLSLTQMRRELFPEFSLDMISISVPYPGASPEEVEEGICLKVEEQIEGIDGIKRISSTSAENVGSVIAELEVGADITKAYNDIKNKIDGIFTFPEESEEPTVSALTLKKQAIYVVVHGDTNEYVLRRLVEEIRDEIIALPEVSQAQLLSARKYEISIEISESDLRRYELSLDEVARIVRRWSLDLPAGKIKTAEGEILLRAKGKRYTGLEYAQIPLVTLPDGVIVRLGQVATIVDGFEEIDRFSRLKGQRAMGVLVQLASTEDIITVVDATKAYLVEKRKQLPEGLGIITFGDASAVVRERIALLVKNGLQGLFLVFLALCLFLRWRLAFWIAMGIPISFMGGFILLKSQDATINMISLFAFIMVLGIVVDDAIIVGENIFRHFREGATPFHAAVDGAAEVGWPVTISVLTTMVAFAPLLFVSGVMGKFISIMPTTVIAVLAVSLMEAFLILPAHLHHSLSRQVRSAKNGLNPGWRHRFIQHIIDRFYVPVLRPAIRWRYVTVALAFGAVIFSVGLVVSGRLPFVGFPKVDSDYLVVQAVYPDGATAETTNEGLRQLEEALDRVREEMNPFLPEGRDLVAHKYVSVGSMSPTDIGSSGSSGSNVGEIFVELIPAQLRVSSKGIIGYIQRKIQKGKLSTRNIGTQEITDRWREETGQLVGIDKLTFIGTHAGPGGAPIQIQLLGKNMESLRLAADEIKEKLATYEGVRDIRDDFAPGKWELKVKSKPQAKNLGLSLSDLARQVREGFYGAEALRIQRGSNEIKVMVRYPESERRSRSALENIRVRTPQRAEVPLGEVADIDFGRGYSAIKRVDGKRSITVTADIDEGKANAREILAELRDGAPEKDEGEDGDEEEKIVNDEKGLALFSGSVIAQSEEVGDDSGDKPRGFLPLLTERHPSVSYDMEGQAKSDAETFTDLMTGLGYALFAIFCLLAVQFRSYIQPVIIMAAIPVSLVGVIAGHIFMGLAVTLISVFGIVALTGIVVNDSLVLIDFINRRVAEGGDLIEGVVESGKARFRAIILTSMTTIAGLAPLLIERSMQAQILIPMAVSVAFGLAAATALTLVVTPCLYLIVADVKALLGYEAAEGPEEE